MKLLLTLSLASAFICTAAASTPGDFTGRIENLRGDGIAFATVILLHDGAQAAGATADSLGGFALRVPAGNYTLQARHLSYRTLEQAVTVGTADNEPAVFRLSDADVTVGEVVVTATAIKREADRFVMSVGELPTLAGKDGVELLAQAPGVWIDDAGLAINGMKGVKVFVDDRELRLSGDKLSAYLRSLTAADIARVEVIPQAGAEYGADARGGVLRIVLRRQRANGVNGSLSMATVQSPRLGHYAPSGNISARVGKWTLNAGATGLFTTRGETHYDETRAYPAGNSTLFEGWSELNNRSNFGSGRIGAFYDISTRHTIGAEAEYTSQSATIPSEALTRIGQQGLETSARSRYSQGANENRLSAAMNYIWKIDTLGSAFKLLFDYTRQRTSGDNGYDTRFTTGEGQYDTTYRSATASKYDIVSAEAGLEKRLPHGLKLLTGLKYTHNALTDHALYEGFRDGGWEAKPTYSYDLSYTEQIAAAYASLGADVRRWSFSAGLRGEYTATDGRGSEVHRSYFGLFPSASVNYAFNDMRTWMLAAQYSRNIERPGFLSLNPARIQFSDYNYMIGNPALRPTYINRFSLTAIWKYRYTLTVGGNLHHDLIREVCKTDPENPNVTYITPENHYTENHWFVALTAPVQLMRRWTLTVNFVGVKQDIRMDRTTPLDEHWLMFANVTTGVTLPAKFYFELSYNGQSRLYSGNSEVAPRHMLNAALKKRLCRDRLVVGIAVQNINGAGEGYRSTADGMVRSMSGFSAWGARYGKLSLTWNFRSGRDFKARKLEGAAEQERLRLKKSQNQ